jgi:hypothetical protein
MSRTQTAPQNQSSPAFTMLDNLSKKALTQVDLRKLEELYRFVRNNRIVAELRMISLGL